MSLVVCCEERMSLVVCGVVNKKRKKSFFARLVSARQLLTHDNF